jgi:tetratricopeptide (TPR) repeat protein
VLALRQQDFDLAFQRLDKARELAPENSQILSTLGTVESKRGHLPEAIKYLAPPPSVIRRISRQSIHLHRRPNDRAVETNDREAQALAEKILAAQPDNLAVLLELTRLAAKRGDAAALKQAVARIAARSQSWPAEATQQLNVLQTSANSPNPQTAGAQVAFLRNTLVRFPEYRQSLAAVKVPFEDAGEPFERLILLQTPDSSPAVADDGLSFTGQPLISDGAKADWAGACSLTGRGQAGRDHFQRARSKGRRPPKTPFPGGPPQLRHLPTASSLSIMTMTSRPILFLPGRAACASIARRAIPDLSMSDRRPQCLQECSLPPTAVPGPPT